MLLGYGDQPGHNDRFSSACDDGRFGDSVDHCQPDGVRKRCGARPGFPGNAGYRSPVPTASGLQPGECETVVEPAPGTPVRGNGRRPRRRRHRCPHRALTRRPGRHPAGRVQRPARRGNGQCQPAWATTRSSSTSTRMNTLRTTAGEATTAAPAITWPSWARRRIPAPGNSSSAATTSLWRTPTPMAPWLGLRRRSAASNPMAPSSTTEPPTSRWR
jgi:hypothetical protein